MHIGIATIQSLEVGLVFVSTLPTYLVGFACDATIGSPAWTLAATIALVPSLTSLLVNTPIPESWPWTSVSLFMWNGDQVSSTSSTPFLPYSILPSYILPSYPR